MVPNFMTASDIKAGRLVKPFAIEVRQPGRWYLICRRGQRGDARTTRFHDWSAAGIAADRRW
jgi:LysR family glycine cleavage system transcriptional activator